MVATWWPPGEEATFNLARMALLTWIVAGGMGECGSALGKHDEIDFDRELVRLLIAPNKRPQSRG